MVSPPRAPARQSAQAQKSYLSAVFPSPTLGWVASGNLADPKPGGAHILDNFFPTATGAVLRRGQAVHTIVGDGTQSVRSLFTFIEGNTSYLFAATENAIYDASSPSTVDYLVDHDDNILASDSGDDLISQDAASSAAVVSGLSGGNWITTQFTNTNGEVVLRAVNGADTPLVFDGSSWSTDPAITFPSGETLTPDVLSYVWPHMSRLFFIQKDSLNAWYLDALALGGELKKLPLGNVFKRGGSLLFGASWSLGTSGSGGLSEQCVFMTTEGEVVAYQGTDPSVASSWSRVGTYQIGKPLGPKAHIRAGGDIVVATDIGFNPLSQAVQKDIAALAPAAVSAPIETAWNETVNLRTGDWNCIVWSNNQMAIVLPPPTTGQPELAYVANARTGAWSKFTNWSGHCIEVFQGRLLIGGDNGEVIECNVTGLDFIDPYTGVYVPLFNTLGTVGAKTTSMSRATLRGLAKPVDRLSMQRNFEIKLPLNPSVSIADNPNAWDIGKWDQMQWGVPVQSKTYQAWRITPTTGYAVAPALQITSGSVAPIDIEIISIDVAYTNADEVV